MNTPTWMLRVLGAVLAYEDWHAKGADPCFSRVLALAPDDVLAAARALQEHAPLGENEHRLDALRKLAEAIRDGEGPMPQHGIDMLTILDMPLAELERDS